MTSWQDVLGTGNRVFIKFEMKDGEALFNVDRPTTMSWAQFMNMLEYLVTLAISENSDMTIDEAKQTLMLQDLVDKGIVTTWEKVFKKGE